MKIAISQPTYLPWIGYFDLIDQVDAFVVLDSVQFEKRSWQQRNRIKSQCGLQWLTVPVMVRGRFDQLISEVEIQEPDFWQKHYRAIEHSYRRAPCFARYFPALKEIFESATSACLIDLNLHLIEWFMRCLGVGTRLVRASDLGREGKRSQLLVNICEAMDATCYLSPIGSAEYLLADLRLFEDRKIEVTFQHYEHPQYRQLFGDFVPYASVLDLLFNEGERSGEIMRSGRRSPLLPQQVAMMSVSTEKA